MSDPSYFRECRNVLFPVGAIHGDGPAVLTPPSGRQEQGSGLGDGNGGLIDSQPSGINRRSPLDIVKR